jgi:hypothetical protein
MSRNLTIKLKIANTQSFDVERTYLPQAALTFGEETENINRENLSRSDGLEFLIVIVVSEFVSFI